jgi:tetratricopeptide (TPR) repeat protein
LLTLIPALDQGGGRLWGQATRDLAPRSSDENKLSSGEVPRGEALDWLSRDRYSRRQQATLQMWRDREKSREQVQEAARHPDPEVAGRAKWILRQWRRGALPDTPPEIARLLQASDGPAAIERLLEGGQFTAAVVAIEESAGTVDREAIQTRIASALLRRFPLYVHQAIGSESLGDLLRLVDLVADSKELALCRIELMQHLGIDVTAENLLPSSATLWSARERAQAETLLWMMLGDVDEAIRIATQNDDGELLQRCRMMSGRWSEAAAANSELARQSLEGSYEHARLWSRVLVAADRCEDDELRAEAVEALSRTADDSTPEGEIATEIRWRSLVSHGEVDAALEVATSASPVAAALVCVDGSRVERAFDILGFPIDQIDLSLDDWIDEALESQRQFSESQLTVEIRRLFALMRCLLEIGRDDAAWSIAKRLSEADITIDSRRMRDFVVSTLATSRRNDWVVDFAVGKDDKNMGPYAQTAVATTLPDCQATTFGIVVQAMTMAIPAATLQERVAAAAALFRGEIPRGFDPRTDFRQLYQFIGTPRTNQRFAGSLWGRQSTFPDNLDLVLLFARHGESELAAMCLEDIVETGDAEALFFKAEQELDGGRTDTAKDLFNGVYEIVQQKSRVSGRFGGTDDVALAVKASIGLWIIARRAGDDPLSEQLEREIGLALCSPSVRLRSAVAEYLADREETDLAMEAFQRVLPLAAFGNEEQTGLYDVARVFAPFARNTDLEEAVRWFDLAVADSLDQYSFRSGAYITLPLFISRWALEAAIKRGDREQVERHLERIMQLDPLDIDFAERLLPEMRERSMGDLANETLDQIIDRGLKYARRFPFDAMTCNNLAWVAAMNQQRLDDALELAEKAVYAEPESAIYRDTLAEVLFLLDRKQEALQIERGCLLDDPGQWHLHEQIEKYEESIDKS